MQLIDHKVADAQQRLAERAPIKVVAHGARPVAAVRPLRRAPVALPSNGARIGVEQAFRPVEQQPLCGVVRAVEPVGVNELPDVQPEHDHGIDVADLVQLRERQYGERLRIPGAVEQHEFARGRAVGLHGKIDPARDRGRAVNPVESRAHVKPRDAVERGEVHARRQRAAYVYMLHGRPPFPVLPAPQYTTMAGRILPKPLHIMP